MSDSTAGHVVWLSGQPWDCMTGSDRAMAVGLSSYAPILWVDSPASLMTRSAAAGAASRFRPQLSPISDRMTRLTTVALPGLSRPGVRETTPLLVRNQVRWALGRLGVKPRAVIMAYLGDLLGGWGDGVVNVLYGTDDWVAGAELTGMSTTDLIKRERRAIAHADVIAAVSPQLAARWAGFGASAAVIPNGCWPDDGDVPPAPPALSDLSGPVVGLVGYLSDRVDIEILLAIAEAGLTLLLVGRKNEYWEQQRFAKLTSLPNVRYVGPVPSSQVRSYMSAIDIGITPYGASDFNNASFPLKTLEYLGAGIPVVSTSLPASRWLLNDLANGAPAVGADQMLALVDGAADFVPAIRRLIDGDVDRTVRAKSCVAFAEQHSWRRRAADFATATGIA